MNSFLLRMLFAATLLAVASARPSLAANETAPVINIESVGLTDVIKNLARQAGLNYLLDPSLSEPSFGPDGKMIPPPKVTMRRENSTAMDALLEVLKRHNLQLVENPVTKVWRIGRIGQATTPVDPKWVAADTNEIPLITMDDVPLDVALANLTRQAKLNFTVDPAISRPPLVPGGRPVMPPTVSIRLEKLTARQALAALVENYGLVLKVDAASGTVSIAPRPEAAATPGGPNRSGGPGQ